MRSLSRRTDRRQLVIWTIGAIIVLILCFAGPIEPAGAAESAANVDAARITKADQDPANWMTYGRTYSEHEAARPCLVFRSRYRPRSGGDAACYRRCAVRLHGVKYGQGIRRQDRQAALVLRSRGAARARRKRLLRRGKPRRGRLEGKDLYRHLRRQIGGA
jgi:hypothetical protein